MERLHRESQSPQYSQETRQYMLRDRDERALRARRAILNTLQTECANSSSVASRV
jgi:hypothetical protein